MKKVVLLSLLLLPLVAIGQTPKSEPLFEKAVEKSIVGQYEEAIKLLHKAIDIDPGYAEAYHLLGNQLMALGQYALAREQYQHSLDLNPKSTRWQQEARDGVRTAEWRQHAVENPVPYQPINLGPNINTADDEYMPALTADYRTLVFTRRSPRNALTQRGLPQEEDFYISLYDTMELVFGPAERMPEPLNSHGNEGAQTISHDGRIVIFTGCGRNNESTGCDLYMSVRHGDRWGKPRNLGAPVNSVYWESFPSLSIDGYTLYFASNRSGGYGGTDIWYCTLEEGRWSKPKNMGPTVNTRGNETAPYIHFDDRTLYFASDGRLGMGGSDLYMVKRTSDSTWGTPVNLGYPINTPDSKMAATVTIDEEYVIASDTYALVK